jgi:ornithine cyclodeaminase/alanine dehydrogenase-like protein (mu-crystallin family)
MAGGSQKTKFAREPGTYCGFMLLFSARDATPVAMINDGVLQHMRVGAGAGLGVRYLSRPDSRTVGMIGSGGMARTYLDAIREVRPVTLVRVYSPNADNVKTYAEEMSARHGIDVVPASSAREAVAGADIVACCTSSIEPVFLTDWLEPGMHVTNVTSPEIQPDLPRAVDVALRAGEATPRLERLPAEAWYARGGFLGYVAGDAERRAVVPRLDLPDEIVHMPRLVDLLRGDAVGRTDPRQMTFFLNVGAIGAQFEAVAAAVYAAACEQGVGHEIPTEWFLQNVRD